MFAAQNGIFDDQGWIMRGGSIVDATIIAAPSSTKNAASQRDPEMHQTRKSQQWYFGLKALSLDSRGVIQRFCVAPGSSRVMAVPVAALPLPHPAIPRP